MLYGNTIQLRRLLSSLNVFQVPMTLCKSCKETVPSLYSVAMPVPERIDCYSLQGDIVPLEKGLGLVNILVIIGYFAVLAGIGIYFSRRQKSTNDYFKGGGRIPWWAAGLSLFGTAVECHHLHGYTLQGICH